MHHENNLSVSEQSEAPEQSVKADLQRWASELGFSQIGVASVDLSSSEEGFLAWLEAGFAGSMAYMHRHGLKRMRPAELVPGTVSVITVRMNYLPKRLVLQEEPPKDWRSDEWQRLHQPDAAVVSVYARGRDYHKVMRARLADLVQRLSTKVGPLGYRVFADSAPVAEVELAQRSGLGWRGKHTLLLNRQAGRCFFWVRFLWIFRCNPRNPLPAIVVNVQHV
jgi:epoxyqueuosine reductase